MDDAAVRAVDQLVQIDERLGTRDVSVGERVERRGSDFHADGPLGQVRIRFAAPNELGVLDHDVRLPDGSTVHNPMRVVPNGPGSEVTFVLLRLPGVNDDTFARDASWVERDLKRLKELLEGA